MRYLYFLTLILISTVAYAEERTFVVNKSTSEIWTEIKNNNTNVETFPRILYDADLAIQLNAFPKRGYYSAKIELLSPYNRILGFHKEIELWNYGPRNTLVKSSCDIYLKRHRFPFRWLNLIKDRILNRIENLILDAETVLLQ